MTPLQLRIQYKTDTGKYPTYGKDNDCCHNYTGGLTHEYAEWLEKYQYSTAFTHYGAENNRRLKFKFDTGKDAVWLDANNKLIYTKGYKQWLEELIYERLTIINK